MSASSTGPLIQQIRFSEWSLYSLLPAGIPSSQYVKSRPCTSYNKSVYSLQTAEWVYCSLYIHCVICRRLL